MKLYEYNDAIERIMIEEVDHATGEISEEAAKRLDALEFDRVEKIRQCMLYMKGEQAEAAGIQSVIDNLSKRKAVHDAHAKWLASYIERNTNESDDIKDPRGRVYYKESPGRVEYDYDGPDQPDGAWIEEHVDKRIVSVEVQRIVKVDKNLAKKLLKDGPVAGVYLDKPKLFRID